MVSTAGARTNGSWERLHVNAASGDPFLRGRVRGDQVRSGLATAADTYLAIFAAAQVPEAVVRSGAERSADAAGRWRWQSREEMDGIASGAGVEPWLVHALNARTEILAQGAATPFGECTTAAHRNGLTGRTCSVQTWDWHLDLENYWHTHETRGGRHGVVGVTEHGVLGKIGVNSAGLGVHFNFLAHESDGVGGVPLHVIAAAVLEECADVEEAVELVLSAEPSASSALTLADSANVATVEMSPVGTFVVGPSRGSVVRTNHFLHPTPRAGELDLSGSDTAGRYDLVRSRLDDHSSIGSADELLSRLRSGPGEAPVCRVGDPGRPLGQRWATLCTVVLEPAARTVRVSAGSPNEVRPDSWRTLVA